MRIQKVLSEGVQFWCLFFLVDEGVGSKYHYKRVIIGLPVKRHLSKKPYKWHFTGVPMMTQLGSFVIFQGIRTSIAKEPIILWFFRGAQTPCPPLWIRSCAHRPSKLPYLEGLGERREGWGLPKSLNDTKNNGIHRFNQYIRPGCASVRILLGNFLWKALLHNN